MTTISKKLALKIIAKLPIPKEQKEEIKKGVLQQLEPISKMTRIELQTYMDKTPPK
jgi:hypothetical protein